MACPVAWGWVNTTSGLQQGPMSPAGCVPGGSGTSAATHLEHLLIQDPGAEHDDTVDIYDGVVTAVQELRGLLFTVKDQGDVFLVDTESDSVPPAGEQTA